MKVLLTGSNGFLGRIITDTLSTTFSIDFLNTKNSHIICDLSLSKPILNQSYDLVIHAAGKAHVVPDTDDERKEFFSVNVKGTKNLLTGLENAPSLPKSFVFISSVAVYGLDTGLLIKEDAPLLAEDPYGKSKIEAEKLVYEWCKNNNVTCTILRLPLLVGSNPPGNLKAMIEGIKKRYYFNIADGRAKKSMVLAEDIAKAIPIVAKIGGIYNLTDRYHPSFSELSENIAQQLQKNKPYNMPLTVAKIIAWFGDFVGSKSPLNSKKLKKIMADLTFDDDKAVSTFGWTPTPVLTGFKLNNH